MRDFGTLYRKSIKDLLTNSIYIGTPENSVPIPVYADQVDDSITPYTRDEPPKFYVVISNILEADASNKHTFETRTSIQLDCYSRFPVGSGHWEKTELMADYVKQLLLPDHIGRIFLSTEFNLYRGSLDLARYQPEFTKYYNLYRKIIIFSHSVEEATVPNPYPDGFDYTLKFYLS